MTIAAKVDALLASICRRDLDELSPAERRRFASLCRHAAALAEPPPTPPKSGVLCELEAGRRAE
jgi:hypothetical protein